MIWHPPFSAIENEVPWAKLVGVTVTKPELLFTINLTSPITVPSARVAASAVDLLKLINDEVVLTAPLAVWVEAVYENFPLRTAPVPFATRFKLILVSVPVAEIIGPAAAAAFAMVISLVADAVADSLIISAPFVSLISVPIVGELIIGVVSVYLLMLL